MSDRPTIGRIVHYVLAEPHPSAGEHRAAIVTWTGETWTGEQSMVLHVFYLPHEPDYWLPPVIAHDEDRKAPGTWHWPERE